MTNYNNRYIDERMKNYYESFRGCHDFNQICQRTKRQHQCKILNQILTQRRKQRTMLHMILTTSVLVVIGLLFII